MAKLVLTFFNQISVLLVHIVSLIENNYFTIEKKKHKFENNNEITPKYKNNTNYVLTRCTQCKQLNNNQ